MSEWQDVSGWGPSYGDLFEEWEVALAKKAITQFRAKYPWLRILDFDDLLQECLIHWYFNRAKFREGKGASIKTFMARVLDLQLKFILRRQLTSKRRAGHLAEYLDKALARGDTALPGALSGGETSQAVSIRIDVQSVLEELTPLQRLICTLLSQDYSVKKVAEILGKPRTSVRDEIKRIRHIFYRKGLKDYVA